MEGIKTVFAYRAATSGLNFSILSIRPKFALGSNTHQPFSLFNIMNSDIIDLQSRIAYLEDTIQSLNDVITRQDADISELKKREREINKKLSDLSTEINESKIKSERPPHY